jgi:hypothetical protein
MSPEDKMELARQFLREHNISNEALAANVSTYSQTYILKVLRRGIKDPSDRVANVILEAAKQIAGEKSQLPKRVSHMPKVSRETVMEILHYLDSNKSVTDIATWQSGGMSLFEAKLTAVLMHMNKSIL